MAKRRMKDFALKDARKKKQRFAHLCPQYVHNTLANTADYTRWAVWARSDRT